MLAVTALSLLTAVLVPGVADAATATLVGRGSTWKYLDNGTDQGTAWHQPGFNDAAWKSGPAELGYGDGGEKTVVSYGSDPNHKYRTTYFRRTFSVADPAAVTALGLDLLRDDGAAVYINGTEVVRSNLPAGPLTYLSDAVTWDISETTYETFSVPRSTLVAGTNTIAVEVHQNGWASSDISMDLGLTATTAAATSSSTPTSTTTTTTTAPACRSLGPAVVKGQIGDPAVIESSGLAAGARSPGVFYTHNDSGDTARFFAMTAAGRALGRFSLSGAGASDWEDMAVGRGPVAGQSYLWFGDIGGPNSQIAVYRVPEPAVSATAATSTATTTLTGVTRFDLTYPNGAANNAETLLVDPVDGSVNIVTKTVTGTSEVFRFIPGTAGGSLTPTRVRSIPMPAGGNLEATGGSVSPDGSTIVVRTYDRVLRWHRAPGVTVADALAGTPCVDTLAWQPQGESVAFAADGRSLSVTSEGSSSSVTAYALP